MASVAASVEILGPEMRRLRLQATFESAGVPGLRFAVGELLA